MLDYIPNFVLTGILSTFVMTLFLWLITAMKIINVDMVRALGSFVTKSEETSLLPGIFIHFTLVVAVNALMQYSDNHISCSRL